MNVRCMPRVVFEARCRSFGLEQDAALTSLVREEPGVVCLDADHPAFPNPKPRPPSGAGSELERLLSCFFIKERGNCKCGQRAMTMDKLGTEWCRENLELITGWLTDEATRRKIPYTEALVRSVVVAAISRAEAKEMSQKSQHPT